MATVDILLAFLAFVIDLLLESELLVSLLVEAIIHVYFFLSLFCLFCRWWHWWLNSFVSCGPVVGSPQGYFPVFQRIHFSSRGSCFSSMVVFRASLN